MILRIFLVTNLFFICTAQALELSNKQGISPYKDSRDAQAVKTIAIDTIDALVSFSGKREKEKEFECYIKPLFYDPNFISNVYLYNNVPVGFINYTLNKPWHSCELEAKICHLAVAEQHRHNGYGGALLNNALTDCKDRSAARVSLWTTASFDSDLLKKYYARFGLQHVRTTKPFFESQYALRFKPHPAQILARRAIGLLRR